MFSRSRIRQLYEDRKPRGFVSLVEHLLGLADEAGNRYHDVHGNIVLRTDLQRVKPSEFSLRALAEALVGEEWVESLGPGSMSRQYRMLEALQAQHAEPDPRRLFEAGPGVDVSAFLNINAYSLAVGGLIQAQILEKYQNPAFVVRGLFETRTTKLNGEKLIGTSAIGDASKRRKESQQHPRAGFGERWVQTPETYESALAVEVTRESVFFDLTGQVLDTAAAVGEEIGYREEIDCIDVLAGISNTYSYKGTSYNTYQTATPWINDQVKALATVSDVNDSLQLLNNMNDPETGKRILVDATEIVTVPSVLLVAENVLHSTEYERRADSLTQITKAANPFLNRFKVVTTPLLHQRHTDATAAVSPDRPGGLGLSEANSKRWYHGNLKKGFAFMQNWPLTVSQASPQEYEMLDRGIIAAYFANMRGTPAVKDPRFVVRNKIA